MAGTTCRGLAEVLQLGGSGTASATGMAAAAAFVAAPLSRRFGGNAAPRTTTLCEPHAAASVARSTRESILPGILSPLAHDLHATRYYKHHAVRPEGVGSVFDGKNLLVVVARGGILSLSPLMDTWFREVVEIERQAEANNEPPPELPPFPDIAPALGRFRSAVLKDISIQVLRRGLELLCSAYASTRVTWKLLKKMKQSAVRKAERGWSFWRMTSSTCTTAIRSNCLNYIAELAVTQAVDCYVFLRTRSRTGEVTLVAAAAGDACGQVEEEFKGSGEWLLRKTAFNVLYVSVRCVGAGAMAGIMSNANAQRGTFAGFVLGDLMVGSAVVYLIGPIIDK